MHGLCLWIHKHCIYVFVYVYWLDHFITTLMYYAQIRTYYLPIIILNWRIHLLHQEHSNCFWLYNGCCVYIHSGLLSIGPASSPTTMSDQPSLLPENEVSNFYWLCFMKQGIQPPPISFISQTIYVVTHNMMLYPDMSENCSHMVTSSVQHVAWATLSLFKAYPNGSRTLLLIARTVP